jgi:hypothetical protein
MSTEYKRNEKNRKREEAVKRGKPQTGSEEVTSK